MAAKTANHGVPTRGASSDVGAGTVLGAKLESDDNGLDALPLRVCSNVLRPCAAKWHGPVVPPRLTQPGAVAEAPDRTTAELVPRSHGRIAHFGLGCGG